MQLFALAVIALALWPPSGWAARKKPESPVEDSGSPSAPALIVPAHPAKGRKQLAAGELILGKGVAEETSKSGAGVESVAGEEKVPHKGRKFSILKNSVLRRKVPALPHLDGQNLGKGAVAKKEELAKHGKKVLETKKINTSSTVAKPEIPGPETNFSVDQPSLIHHAKKRPVKGDIATHRTKAKQGYIIVQRNATQAQTRKVPGLTQRNESQAHSGLADKSAIRIKERKEARVLHSNVSQALLPKENLPPQRNANKPSSRRDHSIQHRNASHTLMWKEHHALTRNSTQAQGAKETRFLHKNSSRTLTGKQHSLSSTNISWISPGQKQVIFQRNGNQTQTNKKFRHKNDSRVLEGKKLGTTHRNTSQVEARKGPISFHKNASWAVPQTKLSPSFKGASQSLPRKRHNTHQRNISWAEVNKEHRPSQRNASWALPRKDSSSSHRNVSRKAAGAKYSAPHRNGGQIRAEKVASISFRHATHTETVKEQRPSRKNVFQAGTPRWRLTEPRERGEPIMPSLPTTCLLSEHAIACGNARLKHVPRLSDSALKTLYLAENEITSIPAGIFLGLPSLEWLDLSKNKLDSEGLHPGAFKNLTKLKRLNLDGNQLTKIPALPSSLQELKLNDNNLEGLQRHSFQGLFKLLTLELEGNQLHDGNVLPTTFKPLGGLTYLRLDHNRFRAIPSGLPPSLRELHLDSNHIEEVAESVLNKTVNLTVLVLSNNKLQEDRIAPRAWIDHPKLEALDLSHNLLVHVPSFLPRHLKQLTLHHNRIERIPGYVFAHMKPGLEFLHLSHNVLRDDGIDAVSFLGLHHSLAELLLDNNQLQSIPRGILNLRGLQVLRLSHNCIRHVPLNSVCDTRVAEDSNIVSMHLENNLIDRRRIPPTAFSCIKAYHSVVLRPQQNEEEDY
uniref:Extracellular matrix protein 2-like n=1 Tax=Pogona vitticeps TaxID=103695 RepID=A0A6J0TRF0_9SAUR